MSQFKNLNPKTYARIDNPTDADIKRARSDFPFFCGSFLMIKPKKEILVDGKSMGPLMSFNFNPPQQAIWNIMQEAIREGNGIKLIVLKARQFGASTFFCAWLFWLMWRRNMVKTGIASHKKGTSEELVETLNTYFQNMPQVMRPTLRNTAKAARVNRNELYFADRNSTLSTAVANEDAFRGQSLDAALCTEVSSYKDADLFFEGFLPAMSESSFTSLILESTPKDGWFRSKYMLASEGYGGYRAIFLPWYLHPNLYSVEIVSKRLGNNKTIGMFTTQGKRIHFDDAEKEEWRILNALAKRDGLPQITAGQMAWRQNKIESYDGDEEKFNQEYPRDAVSCFQRSTHSAFRATLPIAQQTVDLMQDECPDFCIGNLYSDNYYSPSNDITVTFKKEIKTGYTDYEQRYGCQFFEMPVEDHTYTIGADVANEYLSDAEDCAFSVISVYCCNCKQQRSRMAWKN